MAGREERFGNRVARLGDVPGHADRRAPPRAYATGLLPPDERESVGPMAARVDPARVGAAHRPSRHVVAEAARDDAAPPERGPVRARPVDDAGRPTKGEFSVDVAR